VDRREEAAAGFHSQGEARPGGEPWSRRGLIDHRLSLQLRSLAPDPTLPAQRHAALTLPSRTICRAVLWDRLRPDCLARQLSCLQVNLRMSECVETDCCAQDHLAAGLLGLASHAIITRYRSGLGAEKDASVRLASMRPAACGSTPIHQSAAGASSSKIRSSRAWREPSGRRDWMQTWSAPASQCS
jgi:hypothetical protein